MCRKAQIAVLLRPHFFWLIPVSSYKAVSADLLTFVKWTLIVIYYFWGVWKIWGYSHPPFLFLVWRWLPFFHIWVCIPTLNYYSQPMITDYECFFIKLYRHNYARVYSSAQSDLIQEHNYWSTIFRYATACTYLHMQCKCMLILIIKSSPELCRLLWIRLLTLH